MDKLVVKELIQADLTAEKLKTELISLLHNEDRIREIKKDYIAHKQMLHKDGNAPAKAAASIVQFLSGK